MSYIGSWEKLKLCKCGAINQLSRDFCFGCAKEDSMTVEKIRRRVEPTIKGGFFGRDYAFEVYEKFSDPIVELSRTKIYYSDY